jgi:hypothetical protein
MSVNNEKIKEEFAKEFMNEEGLKGKAKRLKIMRIIDMVGYDKRKIRNALLRSDIAEKISHD